MNDDYRSNPALNESETPVWIKALRIFNFNLFLKMGDGVPKTNQTM